MNAKRSWSPLQTVLFTSFLPLAAVVGALALFSFARSQDRSTSRAEASPAATPAREDQTSRRARGAEYRRCLDEMGIGFSRSQSQSRFSAPPDRKKIEQAMSFCRTLIEPGARPPAAPKRAIAPQVA